jgi:rhomboid protease GluP
MMADSEQRVICESRDYSVCAEAGLVLAARGIDYRIHGGDRHWQLSVPAGTFEAASAELRLYLAENRETAMPTLARPLEISRGWQGLIGYVIVLLAVATAANRQIGGFDWLGAGVLDVGRVRDGEWWRTVTALMLHGDLSHLLGNLAFGAFFGHFVARHLGEGVGWAAILASGACGNYLNALVQPAAHRSIGASTAVYGALAILSAYSWRRGIYRGASLRRRAGPIVAGIALLAFTGTAGENTDVVAHLAGFCAGLVFGVVLAQARWITRPGAQRAAGALTFGVIALAWIAGLS